MAATRGNGFLTTPRRLSAHYVVSHHFWVSRGPSVAQAWPNTRGLESCVVPAAGQRHRDSYADVFDEYFRWAACFDTPSIAPISDQLR